MQWSYRLFRLFGIDVRVHTSFLLLLVLIAWSVGVEHGLRPALLSAAVILVLFAFVLLHEFGHSLVARRFGVPVHDIILLPIGGMARLGFIPRRPAHELAIAIAGPAVNLGLILVLSLLTVPAAAFEALVDLDFGSAHFLAQLLAVNLMLFAFNLIPAFPMDGGRVLRSLLALKLDYLTATRIAARVGRGLAVLLFLAGLLAHHYLLCLVAVFIFIGAGAELELVERSLAPPRPAWVDHLFHVLGDTPTPTPGPGTDFPTGPGPGSKLPPKDLGYRYQQLLEEGEQVTPIYDRDGHIIAVIRRAQST